MTYKSDTPMSRSAEPAPPSHAPPGDPNANSAMLKADIDSGATGDKVNAFDPGLSMLGTDDEAAGTPNSAARVNLARQQESKQRFQAGAAKSGEAHGGSSKALYGFIALIVLVGVIVAGALVLR
jgi:hypothetical protein